jgi:hypothetical protein
MTMIRGIRTTVAYPVLALTMLSVLPQPLPADDGTVLALRHDGHRLDFGRFHMARAPVLAVTPIRSFSEAAPAAQASSGWSSYSTAKKTWIIVGIVVGAAAIAVAVSNRGDDDGNGGGGY